MALRSYLTSTLMAAALVVGVSAMPVHSIDQNREKGEPSTVTDHKKDMAFGELKAMSPKARLAVVLDQALQAEAAGRVSLALALYKEAQGLTPGAGKAGDLAYLNIKYRELALEAPGLEWRRVEHRIGDLRKVADRRPFWSVAQLERALAEAEIRFRNQPEDEDKVDTLRALEHEINLMMATRGDGLAPILLSRAREFSYAMEDHYGKREGMKD